MIRAVILITFVFVAALPATAQTYPTIVGKWYAEEIGPQDCGGPHAFHIGPMHYVEEALSCEFKDVARDGWEVTWNGSCNDGAGSLPMRLVATETDGRLTLRFNGEPGWTALRRCAAKSGTAPAAAHDHVAGVAGYTFAYVTGGMVCGMGHGCPERVFKDGEKLGELNACENLDAPAVALDGSRFFECEGSTGEGR